MLFDYKYPDQSHYWYLYQHLHRILQIYVELAVLFEVRNRNNKGERKKFFNEVKIEKCFLWVF